MTESIIEKRKDIFTDKLMVFGPTDGPTQPLTPFAPYFEVAMWNNNINLNGTLIDNLKYYLLGKELDILTDFDYYNDGGTGLGKDDVTTRFARYNLLAFNDPSISMLKEQIKLNFNLFLKELGAHQHQADFFLNKMYYEPYIVCWFNVLRKGQNIKRHVHSNLGNAFISGNICVSATNTETHYEMPYAQGNVEIQNTPGHLTLFPSYLPHWTTKNDSDDVRVSVAFDIYAKRDHIMLSQNREELHKIAIEF